jgi:formate dehydrogenase subunit gamma
MFYIVTIVGVGLVVVAALVHFALNLAGRKAAPIAPGPRVRRYNLWERLVHLALVASALTLAVTGFFPALRGERLSQYLLLTHAAVAPVFAVSLAAMMLTWAGDCTFQRHDREWIRRRGWLLVGQELPAGRFDAAQKIGFWLLGLLGLVLIVTMTLSMMPIFGQDGLAVLLVVHRYAALLMLMTLVMHTYCSLLARRGAWRSMLSGNVNAEWAKRYHPLW